MSFSPHFLLLADKENLFYRSFAQPLIKCRRVFQTLCTIAIPELIQTADALLAPVRLGVCRPAQPFSLATTTSEATHITEELFTVEPLPLRPSTPSSVEEFPHPERPPTRRGRSHRSRRRRVQSASHDQLPQEEQQVGEPQVAEDVEVCFFLVMISFYFQNVFQEIITYQ